MLTTASPIKLINTKKQRKTSTTDTIPRLRGVFLQIKFNGRCKSIAIKSAALSSKVAADEMIVLDDFKLDAIKTKDAAAALNAIKAGKKTLIVLPEKNDVVYKSARNIAGAKVTLVSTLNVYDILNCDTIVVLKDAVTKIEEVYA